jgi:protein phosphatase
MHRSLLQYIDTGDIDLRQLHLSESASFTMQSSGATHKGYIRFNNEDAYLELTKERLWMVADGMGGHKRGDYASNAIVKSLQGFSHPPSIHQAKTALGLVIEDLQKRLLEANETCQKAFRAQRVGSTVTLLFELGGYAFFLWAGDSRIYRLRGGEFTQITRDHSLAQEKFDKGDLNQDEAESHPSAHILTRAVGVHRHLRLQLHCEPVMSGDRYLLCSDGLYGGVCTESMCAQLSVKSREKALKGLIDLALDHGGRDNITGIVVDIE